MDKHICLICGAPAAIAGPSTCARCQCRWWAKSETKSRYTEFLERLRQLPYDAASVQEGREVIVKYFTVVTRSMHGHLWEMTHQLQWQRQASFSLDDNDQLTSQQIESVISAYNSLREVRTYLRSSDANNRIHQDIVYHEWGKQTRRVLAVIHEPHSVEYLKGVARFMKETISAAGWDRR